jgi:predicted RNA-binding protein with PUA-like domain
LHYLPGLVDDASHAIHVTTPSAGLQNHSQRLHHWVASSAAGVRNAQARNNMRSMRLGDLAFFYHSSCKVPGIVGIAKVGTFCRLHNHSGDSKGG